MDERGCGEARIAAILKLSASRYRAMVEGGRRIS
jgi:hypothetical protein